MRTSPGQSESALNGRVGWAWTEAGGGSAQADPGRRGRPSTLVCFFAQRRSVLSASLTEVHRQRAGRSRGDVSLCVSALH